MRIHSNTAPYFVTLTRSRSLMRQSGTDHMYIVSSEDGDLEQISRQFVMESTLVYKGDLTCCRH